MAGRTTAGTPAILLILASVAAGGPDEDFAEAFRRANASYDARDYDRAAAAYREALKIRNDAFPCRLGLAYSLVFTNQDRARAYLFLEPPDHRAALKDIEEYRRRLAPHGSEDDLAQLDRDIARLKKAIEDEKPPGER